MSPILRRLRLLVKKNSSNPTQTKNNRAIITITLPKRYKWFTNPKFRLTKVRIMVLSQLRNWIMIRKQIRRA